MKKTLRCLPILSILKTRYFYPVNSPGHKVGSLVVCDTLSIVLLPINFDLNMNP